MTIALQVLAIIGAGSIITLMVYMVRRWVIWHQDVTREISQLKSNLKYAEERIFRHTRHIGELNATVKAELTW